MLTNTIEEKWEYLLSSKQVETITQSWNWNWNWNWKIEKVNGPEWHAAEMYEVSRVIKQLPEKKTLEPYTVLGYMLLIQHGLICCLWNFSTIPPRLVSTEDITFSSGGKKRSYNRKNLQASIISEHHAQSDGKGGSATYKVHFKE